MAIDPDDLSQSPLWNLKTLRLSSRPSPIAPTVNTVIGSLLGHSHTKTRAKCHRVDDEHFHLENKTFCSRLLLWHFVSFARYYFGWPACCDFSCNSDSLHIPAWFDNQRLVVLQTGSFGGLFSGFWQAMKQEVFLLVLATMQTTIQSSIVVLSDNNTRLTFLSCADIWQFLRPFRKKAKNLKSQHDSIKCWTLRFQLEEWNYPWL